MGWEIERKFLVADAGWQSAAGPGILICQFYLTFSGGVLRIRRAGSHAYLTLKGDVRGITRPEFEFEIPPGQADEIAACFSEAPRIEKVRHALLFGSHTWHVDVFAGAHSGLVMAEVELVCENEPLRLPPWIGREVSRDPRYFNSQLAYVGGFPSLS